jgi:peptide/nickel transport system substrate-binding protein
MNAVMKRLLLCLMALFVFACREETPGNTTARVNGGTARISLQCANDNLFPLLIQESNLRQISEFLLNPPLILHMGEDQAEDVLAAAWQPGTRNTSITYVLNSSFRWSDGRSLSTADMLFTYDLMKSPWFRERMPERFKFIRDIEVIDSLSFRINFNRPVADPLYHSKIPVLPAKWSEYISDPEMLLKVFKDQFVGCGPFLLKRSVPDSLVLVKNPYYPDDLPHLDSLIVYFYTSEERLTKRIRGSQADMFVDLPFSLVNLIGQTPGYEIKTYPEQGYSFIAWNLKKKPFNDLQIRRALTMAIDRDALINGILAGYARKIDGPVYPGLASDNAGLPGINFNPHEAEHLLDEAGWVLDETSGIRQRKGERFEFALMINRENPMRREIALNIRSNLAAIGIQVNIDVEDWQNVRRVIRNKNFDALLLSWVDEDIYDPSQIFHSAGVGYGLNMMSYQNAKADSLIEVGLNAMDAETRIDAWHKFQAVVAEDLPCTFLYNQEIICGLSNSLHDVEISGKGYLINVKDWWISKR